jgi:nucleoside-diphosphate-sugar epimerase
MSRLICPRWTTHELRRRAIVSEAMAGPKILVLGATGPTGINVLRELIHRQVHTVVYARSPSKIPPDLSSSPSVEVRFLAMSVLCHS